VSVHTNIGLCLTCRHARPITSAKNSTFWRCAIHDQDPRYPKYPRLPVLECPRFERGLRPRNPSEGEASEGAAEAPSD
jgi:hypothetical protein